VNSAVERACHSAPSTPKLSEKIKKKLAHGPVLEDFISQSVVGDSQPWDDYKGKLRRAKGLIF